MVIYCMYIYVCTCIGIYLRSTCIKPKGTCKQWGGCDSVRNFGVSFRIYFLFYLCNNNVLFLLLCEDPWPQGYVAVITL